jgi:hypothetical protein
MQDTYGSFGWPSPWRTMIDQSPQLDVQALSLS